MAFGRLSERSVEKTSCPTTFYQSILRFDVILLHDWPIEQCLLYIRVFFGGKTLAYKTNNEHLPTPFFKVIRKSLKLKIYLPHLGDGDETV